MADPTPEEIADLVEQLRHKARTFGEVLAAARDSADALLAQQKRIAELEEALRGGGESADGRCVMTEVKPDYRQILMNLATGFFLCDHAGDAAADILKAVKLAGFFTEEEWEDIDDLSDMGEKLARKYGSTTLYGTSVLDDDDEL